MTTIAIITKDGTIIPERSIVEIWSENESRCRVVIGDTVCGQHGEIGCHIEYVDCSSAELANALGWSVTNPGKP